MTINNTSCSKRCILLYPNKLFILILVNLMTLTPRCLHHDHPEYFTTDSLCVENVFRFVSKRNRLWVEAKRQMPGCLVLLRIGRFYHCFHHDADVLHALGKQYGDGYRAVCAFPFTEFGTMMSQLQAHGQTNIVII